MFYKLDWFSFTFPIGMVGEGDNEYLLSLILMAFHDHTAHRFLGVVTNGLWQWQPVSGFYTHRIQCPKTLLSLSWKPGNNYALCEISGQAIDRVSTQLKPNDLALAARERCTRIDFAVDIETTTTPEDFFARRGDSGFKTTSFIKSPTGETCYLGSRAGERMARVYRYADPHPRSRLLRIEAEYKGDAAKRACEMMILTPLNKVVLAAHVPFCWEHPVWLPDTLDVSKIPARYYDNEGANTLHWLNLTVVPAIKKASETGLIILREWLNAHFPL